MNGLRKKLAEKGFRMTGQREAVLKAVQEANGHLTVEEIYDRTKRLSPDIGIATVYRTIQLLTEIGYVTRDYLGDTVVRYELQKKNSEHNHHHLLCLTCGKIIEAQDDLTKGIEEILRERYGFEVVDHRLQFTGYCTECISARSGE